VGSFSIRPGLPAGGGNRLCNRMETQTPVEQHATKRRPANYHSRLTSKPQQPAVSKRSALWKRLRDLADAFAERLGGWPGPAEPRAHLREWLLTEHCRKAGTLKGRKVS
jgi:hypothetical protein